jgi:hypothetical protein
MAHADVLDNADRALLTPGYVIGVPFWVSHGLEDSAEASCGWSSSWLPEQEPDWLGFSIEIGRGVMV